MAKRCRCRTCSGYRLALFSFFSCCDCGSSSSWRSVIFLQAYRDEFKKWWIYKDIQVRESKLKLFDLVPPLRPPLLPFCPVAVFCCFSFFSFYHIYIKTTNVEQWETKTVQRIKPVWFLVCVSGERRRNGNVNEISWWQRFFIFTFIFKTFCSNGAICG